MMLTKNKTRSRRKWLYLFIIPIIGLLVMSFQQPMGNTIKSSFAMDNEMLDLSSTEIIQSGEDVPSRFPLEDIYRKGITFTYGREGKHPITGKIMIHKGIDFRAPKGSPVYATANGIVATSEFHEKYGKLIVIKHNDTYATLYAHLDNLMVAERNKVAPGQMIGTVGNTGLSTGDHLHYEVRKDGQNVDPAEYYQE